MTGALWATFAALVESAVVVANGPVGGGGGGGVLFPPPHPMIKLITKITPNPNDGRKSLRLHAQQRDKRAARPLRRLRGRSEFVLNGKKIAPRFDTKALCTRAAPESDGARVSAAVEVAPFERFTLGGCSEQE